MYLKLRTPDGILEKKRFSPNKIPLFLNIISLPRYTHCPQGFSPFIRVKASVNIQSMVNLKPGIHD